MSGLNLITDKEEEVLAEVGTIIYSVDGSDYDDFLDMIRSNREVFIRFLLYVARSGGKEVYVRQERKGNGR